MTIGKNGSLGGKLSSDTSGNQDNAIRDSQWNRVVARLKAEFGDEIYETWLKALSFSDFEASKVSLTAPTPFVRDWIARHYMDRIRDYWAIEDADITEVNLNVAARKSPGGNSGSRSAGSKSATRVGASRPEDSFGGTLDPNYTFDSFVVGKSNELAFAAAERVAEASTVPFNPLFLHGGVGLGKTHLMHAIAWEVKRRHPDRKIMYLSAEKFMFQFITALRYKDTVAFKRQFRSVDLLMIDDVQFIANKNTTQEEFFHTFNALVDNRRQVVLSADRSPTDLEGIEERIVSRLGWGLVADIHPTDFELRLGILQAKAENVKNVEIEDQVIEFLARRITSNVRELEGALNRVVAYADLVKRTVSMDMTRDVLQDLLRANDRKITIDEIQRQVAEYYNLRLSEMLSERRARNIARPRQVAMYLSKQMTSRSLPEIGRKFSGRDHTTVMHAVRKVEDLRRVDSAMDEDIHRLSRILRG